MTDPCLQALPPTAQKAVELFNEGEYYRSHEEFENAWRDEKGEVRMVYQAILQVAVVFLHIGINNYLGAIQLGEKATAKFEIWQGICQGIDLDHIRSHFKQVLDEVERLGPERIRDFDRQLFFKIEQR